jgi:hypothetical protein
MTDPNIDNATGSRQGSRRRDDRRQPLQARGRVDQAKGSAKTAVDKVADTLTSRNMK